MLARSGPFRREYGAVRNESHATAEAGHLCNDGSTPPVRSSGLSRLIPATLHSRRSSSTGAQNVSRSETGDRDPLGLQVVYRPEGDHTVDIIFVHGLGGGSHRTWSKNHDPELFWPERFLPAEPGISEARISTFGYNSNFGAGSKRCRMSILDFAKSLLAALKFSQDEYMGRDEELRMGDRPIIFVAHCMGGLIVKEAYLQGQIDPMFKDMIDAVSAIIFLSSPHRGSNLSETLNRVLHASLVPGSKEFIAKLVAGSRTLERLNEQFRHVAPKMDIFSFYETRPTMLKRSQVMILDKGSSVLGYPGEISMPLDGDHYEVCRFDSREDPRYIIVRNALESLIQKSTSRGIVSKSLAICEAASLGANFVRDLPERPETSLEQVLSVSYSRRVTMPSSAVAGRSGRVPGF